MFGKRQVAIFSLCSRERERERERDFWQPADRRLTEQQCLKYSPKKDLYAVTKKPPVQGPKVCCCSIPKIDKEIYLLLGAFVPFSNRKRRLKASQLLNHTTPTCTRTHTRTNEQQLFYWKHPTFLWHLTSKKSRRFIEPLWSNSPGSRKETRTKIPVDLQAELHALHRYTYLVRTMYACRFMCA